jgi:hypothetical protein
MTGSRLRRMPPALVGLAAAAATVVGLGVALQWATEPPLMIGGLLLLGLAVGFWFGFAWARPVGVLVAIGSVIPLGYGLFGLAVVAEQWFECADGRLAVASLVATSYPAGFCAARDWPVAFGTGFALVGVGLAGLLVLAAVLRERRHFAAASTAGQLNQT